MTAKPKFGANGAEKKATFCYQCVAGPDLLTVTVKNGTATECEPNFEAADVHPGGGKCCVFWGPAG